MYLQDDGIGIEFTRNGNCAVSKLDHNGSVGFEENKQTVFGKVVSQECFDTRLALLDSVFTHLRSMTERSR